jgi:AbrB family looped-hinge helix DNA binding protein
MLPKWYDCAMSHRNGKATEFNLVIGRRGRVIIPADIRKRMNLQAGDVIHVRLEKDNSITIENRRSRLESMCGYLVQFTGGKPIVDDLIRERREEAARE